MFDQPRKRIALSSIIAVVFFSLTYVNAQFHDELYGQNKEGAFEERALAKVEKLQPLIYLEKEN